MKIKELKKTVNLAWSPKSTYPIYLAAGTAAQQLDASFNTSAAVELYQVNLNDSSPNLEVRCAFKSENRFHKLIWSNNVIVGGCDAGRLVIYNADELLKNKILDYEKLPGKEDGLIACLDKHKGPVRALDFNLYQKNLLATGASESQFFVWDLNYEALSPISIVAPSQPVDDVTSLSWNRLVQHIIATSFSTRCLIWDLRKSEPIIELTDSSSKIRWKDVKWNPENATQLCLASEEDQSPVIEMWDLKYAKSPMKTFKGHQRGVLSLAWCSEDPDLLISCGIDNKILVWNPNTTSPTGEIIREIPLGTAWNFEVSWCPRNPFLIASSSCDGVASVYSLADGPSAQGTVIADSFPGINQYTQSSQQQTNFGKPPRWMKRPVGASFAFGGKLVTFGSKDRIVNIHQVVTESDLDLKFKELESVLDQGNVYAHCLKKAELVSDPGVKNVWNFIASQFYGENFKEQIYFLLGTSQSSLEEKISDLNITDELNKNVITNSDPYAEASRIGPADNEDIFNIISAQQNSTTSSDSPIKEPLQIIQNNDIGGAISDALLLGNIELAVDLCILEDRMTDAIVLALSGGPELVAKAQSKYFEKTKNHLTTLISAVVTEDWQSVVETCDLSNWKQVLVALTTYTRKDEFRFLCELLGQRLIDEEDDKKDSLICYICAGNVNKLIENWKPNRTGSASEIQEFAELGLLMKEAVKARGIDVSVTGTIANVLLQYAELLTSQGYLKEAYSYLGESQEEGIEMLKDRLMYALGLKTLKPEIPQAKSGYFKQQSPAYAPQYGNINGYNNPPKSVVKPFNSGTPASMFSQTVPSIPSMSSVPSVPSVPSLPSVNPVSSIPPMVQSSLSSMPPMVPMAPITRATPTPPPPPPSSQLPYNNARQTPDHLMQSRSKYILDPSVQGPIGHRNSFSSGGFPPMSAAINQPPVNSVTPFPSQNESAFYPINNQSFYPAGQTNTNSFIQNSNITPLVPQLPVQSEIPAMTSLPPSTPGWNDPPNLTLDKLPSNKISYVSPRVPLTNQPSIFNPGMPNTSLGGSNTPGMPYNSSTAFNPSLPPNQITAPSPTMFNHGNVFNPRIQNNQPGLLNPGIPNNQPGVLNPGMPSNQPGVLNPGIPNNQPGPLNPVTPKVKPPLPEEHMHLQTVFDELRNQCYNKTINAQMKRKLDDVARKLEMLYDAIRESKLSPLTLQSLHQIVKAIQHGNYQECLCLHTELVSGPDFSNIASFMPGIKVLVQSALQLEVYL